MAAVTICSDFGAQKNKVCHCFHCFPIYLPWSDGTRCHDLIFWMLSFKPNFSLSSLIFIKWLFSSSSLSVIRVVSSAYMRLLIFLLAIYIPACAWYNHSVLKEISPEYSLEGLMLKLKLQYFGHLMQRADSLEKTLMLGKIEGRRRRGRWGWDGLMA